MARKSRKTDLMYSSDVSTLEETSYETGDSASSGVVAATDRTAKKNMDRISGSCTLNTGLYGNTKTVSGVAGYRAGLYARLSLENEANRERNTIENQMALLKSFVAMKKDIEVAREYFDISKTGTDFDRPGFSEMMQDIREGKINCVIVKDLSRLGRNYVDAGNYIERVFPFFGVRFIAVNDNYDSENGSSELMVGLSNIFNEHYSRDISRKIKSSERSSWKKGECVTASIAYGLMKSPVDKHRIIPDPEVCENVVRVFDLFIEYKSYSKVARIMTDDGIISPKAYFTLKRTGMLPEDMDTRWIGTSVREILKNRYYVGDSVHGKTECFKFREKKREIKPKEEWIIVENTHEPIVERAVFEEAQRIIADIKRKHDNPAEPGSHSVSDLNMLKDYIFCADCGSKMYLKKQKGVRPQYICSGSIGYKITCKSGHYIMLEDVEAVVMKVVHAHIVTCIDKVAVLKKMNKRQESIKTYDILGKEINRINRELRQLQGHKIILYDDYSSGLMDGEQYREYLDKDKKTEEGLKAKLTEVSGQQKLYDRNFHTDEEWEDKIEAYRNKRKLTRDIVEAFVERVEVLEDKSLDIRLKYDDVLKEIIEITEKRGETDGK